MRLKIILSIVVVAVVLGVSLNGMYGVDLNQQEIQRETITDYSNFPKPTLPSAKVLEKSMPVELMQKTEYPKTINDNYELISVIQDPYYDEVTLFYAAPQVAKTITDTDNIQELVKKGVIVFDYEKIDNLGVKGANDMPIFLTTNGNSVYVDKGLNGEYLTIEYDCLDFFLHIHVPQGLNGEYLTIEYVGESIRLSVYGNSSVDLRGLVKSLDL